MVLKVLNALMASLFGLSVVVQHNDPDPLAWMAIYGAALLCCVLSIAGRLPWQLSSAVTLVAFMWAGMLAPHVIGHTTLGEMTAEWHMTMGGPAVEMGREMGGLLIVGFWTAVLTVLHKAASVSVVHA